MQNLSKDRIPKWMSVGISASLVFSLTGCNNDRSLVVGDSFFSSTSKGESQPVEISQIVASRPAPRVTLDPGGYQVIDELKKIQFTTESNNIFKAANLPDRHKVNFNAPDLLEVLKNTRQYFQQQQKRDPDITTEGILGEKGITLKDILATLDFSIATLEEDIAKKQPIRLQDPQFINDNFQILQWTAFNPQATKQKRLRITKYAVFSYPGSRTPTDEYNIGLYALKNNRDTDKLRLKYTKQDVLTKIYEPGGKEFGKVEPLAYLTREGLESALMEGTIKVNFNDGKSAFLNVDRNNNIPYEKGLKPTEQKRYWYFKPVNEIKGYGHSIDTKISIKPGVTFAGDVLNIGLGRMVVTESSKKGGKPEFKMGIIADTGGAFLPNLHQLDLLAGVFNSHDDFSKYARTLPDYVQAYILVKK